MYIVYCILLLLLLLLLYIICVYVYYYTLYIYYTLLYCIRVSTKTTIFRLMILGSTTKLQVDPAETLSPDSRRWRKTLDISHGNQRSWWFNGQFFMGEIMGKCPLGMDMDPMRMDFFRHGHGNSGFSTWILGDTETYRWGYGMRIWDFFRRHHRDWNLWFMIFQHSNGVKFPIFPPLSNGIWMIMDVKMGIEPTNMGCNGDIYIYIYIYICIVYIYI